MEYNLQTIWDRLIKNPELVVLAIILVIAIYYVVRDYCLTTREGLEGSGDLFQDFLSDYRSDEKAKEMGAAILLVTIERMMECKDKKSLDDFICLSKYEMDAAEQIGTDSKFGLFYKKLEEVKKKRGKLTVDDVIPELEKVT